MPKEPTLKEELEILRGEPIQVFTGDPMDIPCIETSNPEKLCKHPVVSVRMITYNHEPYIRQAIEGVMMQKTDFEFELLIGEDASTDGTREICFEYQKKYPDKIRVLWWHENLYRNPHPAGGNSKRVSVRCRGEFVAFCEGDDFWTDTRKLQKQVDVFRKCRNVGLCFTLADLRYESLEKVVHVRSPNVGVVVVPGKEYNDWRLLNRRSSLTRYATEDWVRTPTAMYKRGVLDNIDTQLLCLLSFRLRAGDFSLWSLIATVSDVAFIFESTALYRIHSGGMMSCNRYGVILDCVLMASYVATCAYGSTLEDVLTSNRNLLVKSWLLLFSKRSGKAQRDFCRRLSTSALGRTLLGKRRFLIPFVMLRMGILTSWMITFAFFCVRCIKRGR